MRQYLVLFLVLVVWEWLATIAVRYIADQSLAAIPANSVLALFWWAAVIGVRKDIWTAAIMFTAAAIGTGLGLWV